MRKFKKIYSTIALLLCAIAVWFGLIPTNPPEKVDSDFSIEHAKEYLHNISQKPHPVGSAEHDRVRDYIITELEEIGFEVEVQKTFSINEHANNVTHVENILARLKGSNTSKAVMLAAHYDTTHESPGVSDDGYGVASIMETARLLSQQGVENDVIFLFTDGEEKGLQGASAFVNQHRWASDVGLVLNFEARGNDGATLMFETSEGNQWMIDAFKNSSSVPVANSLFYELYKRIPNGSDFTVFKQAGMQGLNFASVKGLNSYHTTFDNLEVMNEGTFYHHGTYAYQLAKHFANHELQPKSTNDSVYFNAFGYSVVSYSDTYVIPLLLVTLVAFVATYLYGIRKKAITISGSIGGFFVFILSVVLAGGIAYLVLRWIKNVNEDYLSLLELDHNIGDYYLFGFMFLIFGVQLLLFNLLKKKCSPNHMMIGVVFGWVIVSAVTSLYISGASYIVIPTLCIIVGLYLFYRLERKSNEYNALMVLLLFILPAISLFAYLVYVVYLMANLELIHVAMIVFALAAAPIAIMVARMVGSRTYTVIFPIIGLVILGYQTITLAPSADHPMLKENHVIYYQDEDDHQAYWVTKGELDEYSSQFFSDDTDINDKILETIPAFQSFLGRFGSGGYLERTDYLELQPTTVANYRNTVEGDKRTVSFTMSSVGENVIFKTVNEVSIYDVDINSSKYRLSQNNFTEANPVYINFNGMEQVDMTITLDASQTLEFYLIDMYYGLPEPIKVNERKQEWMSRGVTTRFMDTSLVGSYYRY